LLLARCPAAFPSRPLFRLKHVPGPFEIAVWWMWSQELETYAGDVTLGSIDPSHQCIRHVSRVLKITSPQSDRQRHGQIEHGPLLDSLAQVELCAGPAHVHGACGLVPSPAFTVVAGYVHRH